MPTDSQISPTLSLQTFKRVVAEVFESPKAEQLLTAALPALYKRRDEFPKDRKNTNEKIVWLLRNRGLVLGDLKRFDEALRDLDTCIQIEPRDSGPYCDKGQILMRMGRWGDAIGEFEHTLKRDRLALDSLISKGDCELRTLDFLAASNSYSRALALKKSETPSKKIPSAFSTEDVKERKSMALCCLGWHSQDLKVLERAVNDDPDYPPSRYCRALLLAKTHNLKAIAEFEASFDWDGPGDELEIGVDQQLQQAGQESPFLQRWELHMKFAECVKLFKENDSRILENLTLAEKVLKQCKLYPPHRCSTSCVYFQQCRCELVLQLVDMRTRTDCVPVLDQLLHGLSGLSGDPKLVLLLRLKVQLRRGKAQLERGKIAKAVADIEEVMRELKSVDEASFMPLKDDCLAMVASLKLAQGNFEAALQFLDKATSRTPADPQLWYMRAQCLHAKQWEPEIRDVKLEEAERDLSRAANLCSNNRELKAKIKALKASLGSGNQEPSIVVSDEDAQEEREFTNTILQYEIEIKEADNPLLDIVMDDLVLPQAPVDVTEEWPSEGEEEEEEEAERQEKQQLQAAAVLEAKYDEAKKDGENNSSINGVAAAIVLPPLPKKDKDGNYLVDYNRCRVCFQPTTEFFLHAAFKPEQAFWGQTKGKILCAKCEERVRTTHQDLTEYENCFLCCDHYPINHKCSSCPFVACEGCLSANLGKANWQRVCKLSDTKQWQCFQCAPTATHNAFLPQLDLEFRFTRGCFFDDNFISGYFDLHRRLGKQVNHNSNGGCVPNGKPLGKLMSCCMFNSFWGSEELRGMNYIMGLIVNLAHFPVVWPGWTLRLYYDPLSLSHFHPTVWGRLLRVLEAMNVQLVPIRWPEYTQEDGFHLGLVVTLARFLALEELGKTAKIVVVRDVDTLWSRTDRENIRRFEESSKLYHRYIAGPVCRKKYKWPLWGGGLAVRYRCHETGRKRNPKLRDVERMIHTFADAHMRAPEVLCEEQRISSQFMAKKSVTRLQRGTLTIDMFPYGCDQAFLQDYIFPLMVPSQILTDNICFPFHDRCLRGEVDRRPICGDIGFDFLFPQPWNQHAKRLTWRRKQLAPILNWLSEKEKTLPKPHLPPHSCSSLVAAVETFYDVASKRKSASAPAPANPKSLEEFLAKCRYLYEHSSLPFEKQVALAMTVDAADLQRLKKRMEQKSEKEKEKKQQQIARQKQRQQEQEEEKKRMSQSQRERTRTERYRRRLKKRKLDDENHDKSNGNGNSHSHNRHHRHNKNNHDDGDDSDSSSSSNNSSNNSSSGSSSSEESEVSSSESYDGSNRNNSRRQRKRA